MKAPWFGLPVGSVGTEENSVTVFCYRKGYDEGFHLGRNQRADIRQESRHEAKNWILIQSAKWPVIWWFLWFVKWLLGTDGDYWDNCDSQQKNHVYVHVFLICADGDSFLWHLSGVRAGCLLLVELQVWQSFNKNMRPPLLLLFWSVWRHLALPPVLLLVW